VSPDDPRADRPPPSQPASGEPAGEGDAPPGASDAPGGRSFEDISDVVGPASRAPLPSVATGRRNAVVSTGTAVLFVSALLNLGAAAVFRPSGAALSLTVALGVGQLVAALAAVLLLVVGRWLGVAMGVAGVTLGVVKATDDPVNGLITIALNGFVIYAMASNGPSFRRG